MNSPRLLMLCAALLAPLPAAALSLAEAERRMLDNAPALRAARIELRGSQGDLAAAARRPVAELALGTSRYSHLEGIGSGRWQDRRLDSTLALGWTWERGGKRRLRMREAGAALEASALELADTGRRQWLALHEAYFDLKAAQETLAIVHDNRASSAEAMDAVERQVRVGAEAPIARDRLRVEDLKLAAELRDARLDLLEAQQALALLIGEPDGADALSADDPWPAPVELPAPDLSRVLAERVDLRAIDRRVQAADAARALAHSQRRRDLGLAIEAEREPLDMAGVTWGVSVSVPLHGPNHHRGGIARAEADYDLALLERSQAHAEASLALQQLRRAWRQASERLHDYDSALLPAAIAAREGMELAYRRGAASLTDLLDARRAAREAEADLVDARAAHAIALARWQAAIQTIPSDETAR